MTTGARGLRNRSRRLVLELAVVVLLAGLPIDFPRHTAAGSAWSFLFRHPSLLLHVIIGAVALTESALLVVRAAASRRPGLLILSGLGVASVLAAVAGGIDYVSSGQHDAALTLMTLGWVAAMAVYITGWVLGRRVLRADRPRVANK